MRQITALVTLVAFVLMPMAPAAWAADSYIGVPTDGPGKRLDTEQLTVGSNTVQRQRIEIGGSGATDILKVDPNAGARVNIRNGSGTLIGDSTNPIRVDPTGTTTQPVSGTLTIEQSTGANLHVNCDAGCAQAGDTTGNTATLNGQDTTASVSLTGQKGAMVFFEAGTAADTVTPEVSLDGGTTWVAAAFVNPTTGAISATEAFTNPSAATSRGIVWAGAATDVRVRVSIYASGSHTATLRAVSNVNYAPIYGTTGTTPTAITTLAAGSKTPMTVAIVDSSGNHVSSFGGSGGTSIADKGSFVEGTTEATPAAGVYNETITADPTEDTAAALRITAKRGLHVNLRAADGTEITPMPSTGGTVTVTQGTGTNLHIVCDSGCSGGVQYNEDSAHSTGHTGTMALAVREDTNGALSGTDGDYEPLQVTGGHLKTGVFDSAGNRMPSMDSIARRGYVQISDGTNSVARDADGGLNVHVTNGSAALANDAATFAAGQANVALTDTALFAYNTGAANYQRITSTSNKLDVQCGNCTGAGLTDAAAFTPASGAFNGVGGLYQTTVTNNALTNLQAGLAQVTAYRAVHENPRDSAGSEIADATLHTMKVSQATAANLNVRTDDSGGTGAAVPARAVYLGTNQGGNLTGLIACDSSAVINNAAASGYTQIVAASGTKLIYICSYEVVVTTATSVNFASADTGGACATPVAMEGAKAYAANGGATRGNGVGMILKVPAGKALCINVADAVQVSGSVAYTQF